MSDEALRMLERARLLGDITAHAAIRAYRERKGLELEIPSEFDDYSWTQAFGACGAGNTHIAQDIRPGLDPNFNDLRPFDRGDVKRVIASTKIEGSYAETTCLALMELWDGRFAYLDASCDSTGWD